MATTMTQDLTATGAALPVAALQRRAVHRRIDPQAGRALEKLGHAIEYLTDEYVNEESATFSAKNEKVEAVQLLMALNRQVYFECPFAPTFAERCRSFLRACFG